MVLLRLLTWILLLGCLWLGVAVAAWLGPWLGLAMGGFAAVLVLGAVGVIGFLTQPGIGAPGTRFGEAHRAWAPRHRAHPTATRRAP